MGFLDLISDAWDSFTNTVSSSIEWVGDKIEWVFDRLDDLFGSAPKPEPSPSGSYEDNAEQANNHLAETRKAMSEYAKDAEAKFIDAIMEQHQKTIDVLCVLLQKKGLDKVLAIDFDELKKQSNELIDSVKGNLDRFYNDHLVATNGDVKAILEEANYKERQKKFDSYCESLHRKALDNLKKRIKQAIDGQKELLDAKVKKAFAAIGRDIEKQKNVLDDLLEQKRGKEKESHRTQMEQIYAHGICEILGTELEKASNLILDA